MQALKVWKPRFLPQKLNHWDFYQENLLHPWKQHVYCQKRFSLSVTPCHSGKYNILNWRNTSTQFSCQACANDSASIHTTIHMSSDGRSFRRSGVCLTSGKGTYPPINITHIFRNLKLVLTKKCAHFKTIEADEIDFRL